MSKNVWLFLIYSSSFVFVSLFWILFLYCLFCLFILFFSLVNVYFALFCFVLFLFSNSYLVSFVSFLSLSHKTGIPPPFTRQKKLQSEENVSMSLVKHSGKRKICISLLILLRRSTKKRLFLFFCDLLFFFSFFFSLRYISLFFLFLWSFFSFFLFLYCRFMHCSFSLGHQPKRRDIVTIFYLSNDFASSFFF